eukprot:6464284-Prymnesium_polylepis.1
MPVSYRTLVPTPHTYARPPLLTGAEADKEAAEKEEAERAAAEAAEAERVAAERAAAEAEAAAVAAMEKKAAREREGARLIADKVRTGAPHVTPHVTCDRLAAPVRPT